MSDPTETPPKATRREWTGLAVIALPCMVYAMDLTVLNLALPAISAQLRPSAAQLLWMIDIYGFFVAAFLITMGTLGDRIGRRRLLLIGAAAFALASTIAAFAESAELLIVMRALLGIAGATVAPSTLSLIRNMFHDARERQFAIGLWISAYSVGGAIGPLVGGVLLEFFGWGSVFLAAVPVMVMLLVLGPSLLPEYRDPQAGRIDLVSVVQSLVAVLAVIYGLKRIAEHGWSAADGTIMLAGLAIGVLFVRRQATLAYPLLDLGLLRQRAFAGAIAAYGLSSLAMFGVYIFVTQYLQLVLGLGPLQAGLTTLPWALAFVLGSLLSPKLLQRWSRSTVLVGGLLFAAAGYLMLLALDGPHALPLLIVSTFVMSLGMAPVFTIGNEMIITAAPPQRAGAASALSETASEFSGALGIALLGSAGAALYGWRLVPALPPGLDAAAVQAARATLGGAMDVAQALPAGAADTLREAARAAFVDTLQAVAVVAAALIVLAAWLAGRILRGPGAPQVAEAAAE